MHEQDENRDDLKKNCVTKRKRATSGRVSETGAGTVLVAEDDAIARNTICTYLQHYGYTVYNACDGQQALELVRQHDPELVITDLAMPVMDGIGLLRRLAEEFPDLPVIIVSGVGTMKNVIDALRIGARDYIKKPIHDLGLLKHSIENVLAHARLKKQHERYQLELEELVCKRTAELQKKNEELEELVKELKMTEAQLLQAQKLESVGQLAAGIAHEINTPTQFVSSNIDFLEESFGEVAELVNLLTDFMEQAREHLAAGKTCSPEEFKKLEERKEELDWEYLEDEIPKAIAQSREGVKRVATIVKAMKEFSHPGGRAKSEVDLNHIITTTVTVARNEWKYVADLVTELDEKLELTSCLADEIGQVILNMIVNAAHAIEQVLGKTPDSKKGRITVSTTQKQGKVEIRIGDTGAGIPEEIRHRIFDPFFTTKKVGKGTGQGLSIAHSVVVKKHGGSLTFESTPGKGTTFLITLPQSGDFSD